MFFPKARQSVASRKLCARDCGVCGLGACERGASLAEYAIVMGFIVAILTIVVKQHAAIADMVHMWSAP